MKITHVILHELMKEQHQNGELNCRDKELDLLDSSRPEGIDPVEHLVEQILELYTKKMGKGLGFFEENTVNYPFSKLLAEFIEYEKESEEGKEEDVSEQFVDFTIIAMENFLAKINDEEFATGGYILFTLYLDGDNSQKCCIAMLRNKQGSAIDTDLNVKETIHLDLDKLHICCQIDLGSWQDPTDEDTKYMTFIKGRASSTTPKYFLKFVGCAEFSDSKRETETLTQIIKDYCRSQEFNREQSINFRRKVYDYCKEKSDNHESVYVTDLSRYLNEDDPDKFLSFVNEGDYEVSNGFEIHPNSLKKLQRVTGGNKHIRLSFDANLYGNQIKLVPDGRRITANGQTVVIENTPSNLVDAIEEVKTD